jgi:hypothetical protein
LKWQWSTLGDYEPAAREEVTRWQDPFKALKKRMAAEYKILKKTLPAAVIPMKRF